MKKIIAGVILAIVILIGCGKNPLMDILNGSTATASTNGLTRKVYIMNPGDTEILIPELTLNDMPSVNFYWELSSGVWTIGSLIVNPNHISEGKFTYSGTLDRKLKIVVIK
ncbi:MAG TPA: hypothetical protein DEG71_09075 [Clostridiales bacterium]|nr:hypothetical protein [Clostridiales bacterium]